MELSRRSFLRSTVLGGTALAFGPDFWRAAYAAPAVAGPGPYGPLLAPDANGIMLPAGFSSRIIARAGAPVAKAVGGDTAYVWHLDPDGGAVFPLAAGGWVYTSNSEETPGGVGAVKFDADGQVVDAYSILSDTRNNCSGGATPWGTWLSCEETTQGLVYECTVDGPGQGIVRPAMGAFAHEAVAADPVRERLYLTEDSSTGRLYRFTPAVWGNLEAGVLEVAQCTTAPPGEDAAAVATWESAVTWVTVTPLGPASYHPSSSLTTVFKGGEGIWYDAGHVYFTTKGDNRVWDLDVVTDKLSIVYDDLLLDQAPLTGVDNVTVSPFGDLYVAEDGPTPSELVVIGNVDGTRQVTQFLRLAEQSGTEIAGPAFTPDGSRLYFSSQRGPSGTAAGNRGVTYEVTGPFRTAAPAPVVPEVGKTALLPVAALAAVAAAVAARRRTAGSTPDGGVA